MTECRVSWHIERERERERGQSISRFFFGFLFLAKPNNDDFFSRQKKKMTKIKERKEREKCF